MITKKNIAQALLAGAALAAISSPSFAKPNEQLLPSKSSMKAEIREDIAQRQAEFYNTLSDSSADVVLNQP